MTTASNATPGASRVAAQYMLPALLGLLCLAVFLPAASFEFTNLDDNVYVVDNPALARGLSIDGVRWAFTTRHGDLWMPATWLTYLADHQLGGGTPGTFHRTNIALHVAGTVLLYFVLRRLTGAVWRPALVAALFAIHPLHVESVAWVAERKDVLSGFFFLLALLPHAKPDVTALSPRARLFSLVCFALALMSKPMVVTLPVVLLLLDFRQPGRLPALGRLLAEKIPYLALAAAVSAFTWHLVQTRDIGGPAPLALPVRLAQAIGYYALYLERAVWPTGLSVSYPPEGLLFTPAQIALAVCALAAVSWLAWRGRNQRRLVWIGWLWYLVMLAPVLDLVQGGMQLMSDRYFYLPSIGLFMAVAWLAGESAGRRVRLRLPIAAAAVAMVAVLGWTAHRQVQVWRDSRTLLSHAVAVNDADYLSHLNLGKALEAEGRLAEALPHLQRAVTLHAAPLYLVNLADVLRKLERHEQAVAVYREAVRLQPEFPSAHNNLGNSLVAVGDWGGAEEQFSTAVRQDPAYVDAHCNLGIVRLRQGRADEAAACFRRALELEPGHARANVLLARLVEEVR